MWHIIDGEAGCAHAVAHGCAAVIVDALRASATAAMLFHHGARELRVVRSVEEALARKAADPEALLFGERQGVPPAGFDAGNSPRETAIAHDRRVIFTTTNGARCLVAAQGAPAILFATTVNATAAVQHLHALGKDVVLVPAGEHGVPAHEDRAAAAYLARLSRAPIGEGAHILAEYLPICTPAGLAEAFAEAPHAEALRTLGLDADIAYCAQPDLTTAVPTVLSFDAGQAILRDARPPQD